MDNFVMKGKAKTISQLMDYIARGEKETKTDKILKASGKIQNGRSLGKYSNN